MTFDKTPFVMISYGDSTESIKCISGHPLHTARLVEPFGYVEATVRGHHKDGIVEALRSVSPTEIVPYELLRETKATIFQFCSLLDPIALNDFRQHLQDQVLPATFRNDILDSMIDGFEEYMTLPSRMTWVEEFEEARTLVKDHRLNSTLPVFRPDITVVDVLNGLPLHRACEILESLHDVPTEMTYRKDVFIQFCAILPLNISDQFVLELKREYENRIHYAKRLRTETQTDEESFMCPVDEELHGWWYS
ncbi:hypothetical protein EDD18DRAFT_1339951 [Armillaria luteobubalina]|uniref:Uncharacterized protein n=1 Tax=Armillaria luteobubalina TaxID=153913 RepID=A0AA39NWS2_9AGAR|nr:hypothetical protein EDD18DRAFT_1339951 [Armillaria luteobubalina]